MASLVTVSTVRDARATMLPWREKGDTVAFVPTMGALHKGHMSLVEQARKIAKRSIVSIFVNPMQFGPNEDLSKYPRPLAADQALLTGAGCDLLYNPDVATMYPEGFVSSIDPGPLANVLEGAIRPGHFKGVATVVVKLLLQLMPDVALFGEKDYQQLLVIRRVMRDLDIPIHIMGMPIIRDADGLALSSRNVYLSPDERSRVISLPRSLVAASNALEAGKDVAAALQDGIAQMTAAGFVVDYLTLADAETLEPLTVLDRPARLLGAARMGTTRLIDNIVVNPQR